MSLTIQRFVTQCTVPRKLKVGQVAFERIARDCFPTACARRLATALPAQPGVIRVRRLHLRLTLPGADLENDRFADAWADAFVRALFQAIARAGGDSLLETVRAESRAAWLARVVRDLLAGTAASRWEYSEFIESFSRGTADAALTLLLSEPHEALDTLSLLGGDGTLDRLLRLFNDVQMEELFRAISTVSGDAGEVHLDLSCLLNVAQAIIAQRVPRPSYRLDNRRFALRLFLSLRMEGDNKATATSLSLRTTLHALIALTVLLEAVPESALVLGGVPDLPMLQARTGQSLNPAVLEVLTELRLQLESGAKSNPPVWCRELAGLLSSLRQILPASTQPTPVSGSSWRTVDCAGLLLMVPVLQRLGWVEQISRMALEAEHGPRLITYLLAGLGLSLLNRLEEKAMPADSGAALFAGWLDEPHWSAFRSFVNVEGEPSRRELIQAIGAPLTDQPTSTAQSWAAFFDALASGLVREFAGSIRGFRQASRAFIKSEFLSLAGRVCVEEKSVRIVLNSSPYALALHIAGLDSPVESVSWLGGRRLVFQLEGL